MRNIAGSPRVEGDEEEDDIDDLEHEFNYADLDALGPLEVSEARLSARLSTGHCCQTKPSEVTADSEMGSSSSKIPLLTYGQEVSAFVCVHMRSSSIYMLAVNAS